MSLFERTTRVNYFLLGCFKVIVTDSGPLILDDAWTVVPDAITFDLRSLSSILIPFYDH